MNDWITLNSILSLFVEALKQKQPLEVERKGTCCERAVIDNEKSENVVENVNAH